MSQRSSIFERDPVDISGFKPKTGQGRGPEPAQIDEVAQPKFRSREPDRPEDRPSTKRQPMVYRTGRNTTFSAKTTAATVDTFYDLARRQGWKAGETFERAVEALRRSLGE
jgi:hypothetical protein